MEYLIKMKSLKNNHIYGKMFEAMKIKKRMKVVFDELFKYVDWCFDEDDKKDLHILWGKS